MANRGFHSTFTPLTMGVADFVDTQQHQQQSFQRPDDVEEEIKSSTFDRVVELLNDAQLVDKEEKLSCVLQVQELIVHKEPNLLDNFFDEVTAHFQDRSPDIRKFVLGFLDDASTKDSELLRKVVPFLLMGIKDNAPAVKKKTTTIASHLMPRVLLMVCQAKSSDEECKEMWETMDDVKNLIIEEINGPNDGIRSAVIAFMQMLVIVLSKKSPESAQDAFTVSLDMVPADHVYLNLTDLCEDCGMCLESLLGLTTLADITSTNLMAVVSSLSTIARTRPIFMSTVVQAFEALHASLPPFSKSQVSSVRKNMKNQLMLMLRHSSSVEFLAQITTLLADLGATPSDIAKNKPQPQAEKRRVEDGGPSAKKSKSSKQGAGKDDSPEYNAIVNRFAVTGQAINDFHKDIVDHLTPAKCAELVFVSMRDLPDSMPANFRETFTPIAAAGTQQQIEHLAKLMAIQITAAGYGPAAEKIGLEAEKARAIRRDRKEREQRKSADEETSTDKAMAPIGFPIDILTASGYDMKDIMMLAPDLISLGVDPELAAKIIPRVNPTEVSSVGQTSAQVGPPAGPPRGTQAAAAPATSADTRQQQHSDKHHKDDAASSAPKDTRRKARHIKPFKLLDVPVSYSAADASKQMTEAFSRLTKFGGETVYGEEANDRVKVVVGLAVHFPDTCREMLLEHVADDIRGNMELILSWLYEEYSVTEGYFDRKDATPGRSKRYDLCLTMLLQTCKQKLSPDDRCFTKILLEVPCVTQGALEIVRTYCEESDYMDLGLSTLSELVTRRPAATEAYLYTLLDLTTYHDTKLRDTAIEVTKKLFVHEELASDILKYSCKMLAQLQNDHPMMDMDGETEVAGVMWTEESASLCLQLFMSLLPLRHSLLHDLARVYIDVAPAIKKTINKKIEKPIREIGIDSDELLALVEECPIGAEALITRLLHTLTLDARPTQKLVEKARDLYKQRIPDIRILIPVVIGLDKSEIMEYLPQFVKQQPAVMREVISRLLGYTQAGNVSSIMKSPLTPTELLVGLHSVEDNDEVMKNVMKAISFCFEKETIYSQETIALVVQQLVERQPLPTLFMRTVIQSLNIYPRMITFTMGILDRLVKKQAWQQPKVWQGFVKCCSMTKPQSLVVLLQLPRQQLDSAFQISNDLRGALIEFVKNLPVKQRSGISKQTLKFIENVAKCQTAPAAPAATEASSSDTAKPTKA